MKKLHSCFLFLIFFFFVKSAIAQTDLAIGQWKEHLPFNNGLYVTQSDDKIYYATRYAVLEVDKAERSVRRMTKVEGLSDVGVKLVKYNKGCKKYLLKKLTHRYLPVHHVNRSKMGYQNPFLTC